MFARAAITLGIDPHSSYFCFVFHSVLCSCSINTDVLVRMMRPLVHILLRVIKVALWNTAEHYIFMLWFLSIYLLFFFLA